jgi:predicted nucleic acid-binding Zn ribbon protein
LVQSFSEAGSGTCPECASDGRRLFHAVPVIYKGSGFYTTDYGRPKSPPPEKGEKAEKKDKEPSKASKSSDSNGASSGSSESKGSTTPAASESAN